MDKFYYNFMCSSLLVDNSKVYDVNYSDSIFIYIPIS